MKFLLVITTFVLFITTGMAQVNWDSEIEVASDSYGNYNPKIVLNANGAPIVAWGDGNGGFTSSYWDGFSFSTPVSLTDTLTAMCATGVGPDITAFGDTIYAIFKETPVVSGNIFLVKSVDGGATFSAPVQVDNIGASLSEYVHVYADDNGQPIVLFNKFDAGWANARWVFTQSNDFGSTFTPDILVNGFSGGGTYPVC